MYVCTHIYIYTYVHIHVYTYTDTRMCIPHTANWSCLYLCIYVCMYIYIYMNMYRCIDVYMCICVCIYMYIYIYVYMYICTRAEASLNDQSQKYYLSRVGWGWVCWLGFGEQTQVLYGILGVGLFMCAKERVKERFHHNCRVEHIQRSSKVRISGKWLIKARVR